MRTLSIIFIGMAITLMSCSNKRELPILGESVLNPETGEIIQYRAPKFALTDQFNDTFTDISVKDNIKVVDFFFTSCPTICPQMTNHLKLVQEAFESNSKVSILSFSIDPQNDTPERLAAYSENYQINNEKWKLLTGEQSTILDLAKDYKVRAFDDSVAENINLIHDGTFVLIDDQDRIRGYYNGLDKADTNRLIEDIKLLIGV